MTITQQSVYDGKCFQVVLSDDAVPEEIQGCRERLSEEVQYHNRKLLGHRGGFYGQELKSQRTYDVAGLLYRGRPKDRKRGRDIKILG